MLRKNHRRTSSAALDSRFLGIRFSARSGGWFLRAFQCSSKGVRSSNSHRPGHPARKPKERFGTSKCLSSKSTCAFSLSPFFLFFSPAVSNSLLCARPLLPGLLLPRYSGLRDSSGLRSCGQHRFQANHPCARTFFSPRWLLERNRRRRGGIHLCTWSSRMPPTNTNCLDAIVGKRRNWCQ